MIVCFSLWFVRYALCFFFFFVSSSFLFSLLASLFLLLLSSVCSLFYALFSLLCHESCLYCSTGGSLPTGRSWSDLGGTFCTDQLPIDFLIDFCSMLVARRVPKGRPLGNQNRPKSIPKRGRNSRAKKLPLKSDLDRFCIVLGCVREAFLLIFS